MQDPVKPSSNGNSMSRRDMMRKSLFGAAASWTMPSFLSHTIGTMDAFAQSQAPAGGSGGPILVVLQLSGGNDGLNMVVPHDITTPDDPAVSPTITPSDIYYGERPEIAIQPEQVLPLNEAGGASTGFGLHPAMTNLHDLWTGGGGANPGELAVINGVGYPNANLSHFTSTDFWDTAEPNRPVRDGWVGRYFDHKCSGAGSCDPALGVNLDDRPSLAFHSENTAAGITTSRPDSFGWRNERYGYNVTDDSMENLYRRSIGVDHPYDDGIHPVSEGLAYVQQSAQQAMISSRTLESALAAGEGTFPLAADWDAISNNYLANRLRDVAALIYGGMETQVYYVNRGGFDTHADQTDADPLAGNHANLLSQVDEAVGAFAAEMKAQGQWNRVLLVTVSEFGRKVIQNGSMGTDHGAAAPMLAVGGGVNAGIYGALPSLSEPNRIKNHSLDPTVDFRQVYRTVLQFWLGVPTSQIAYVLPSIPANFSHIPFLNYYS